MRNYLIALLVVMGFSSQAQVHTVRTNGSITPVDFDGSFRYSLKIPVVPDTASALSHGGIDSLGLIIQVRSTGLIWIRDTVSTGGHKWTKVGSGGSGADSSIFSTKYAADTARDRINRGLDKRVIDFFGDVVGVQVNTFSSRPTYADNIGTLYLAIGNGIYLAMDTGWVTLATVGGSGGGMDSTLGATKYGVDTAKQVLRNSIATKRNLADTTNQTGVPLIGRMYKSAIDSMIAINNVRYLKPADTNNIKLRLDTTGRTRLIGIVNTAGRGKNIANAKDSNFLFKPFIDTLGGAWGFTPDSSIYYIPPAGGGISDTTALMRKRNNLSDVTSADTARANIGALGTKKTLGVLYSKTSWTSVAPDWSYTGASGDTSIVLGKIQLVNGNQTIGSGTNSAFNKVLKLAAYGGTLLPYVEIGVKFHISSTLSPSSSGIAVGQPSTNTLGSLSNMMGYYNTTTTGTQAGSLILGTTNTNAATTPQSFPYNQNDELLIVTKRRYDKADLYVKNLTTDSTSATVTFQWDGTNASAINAPNTGMFGIAYLGGTVTIDSVGISSETPFRPNLYLGTDSKGFYTAPTDGSFGWWMQNLFPGTVIAAGPTDVSADLLKRTKEIYSVIQPKQALMVSFPRNDTAFGIARTTWAPNLITVDTTLTNHGIPTFWGDALFENQVNQISTSVFMQTQFGSRSIRLLKLGNSSMVSGDNIHPNFIGARAAAMGVYYSKKLVHYEDVLNSLYKSDDRRDFFADTLRTQMIHMDFGAYHAAALTLGDIGMKEGGALRWAFGSSAQQASIRQNTSNAALDFQNDIGGTQINNAPAFRFIGSSGNATGTVANVMTVDEDGGIAAINPGIRPSILARWMAVRTYINHGFWGGNLANTDSSFAGYVPYDSTSGSFFWNPSPTGNLKFYVSGGVHGGMNQALRLYPTKKTEISDTLLTPKWPNKSSLAGTDSLDAIDASGIHYKIPIGLVAGSDATKKDKADSIIGPGYTTIANKNKLADSLMGVINTLLALKRDIADTAGPNGTARNGHLHQVIDSLVGTFSGGSSPIIFSATAAGTPLVNSTSTASIVGTGVGSATIAANALTVGKTISVHGWFKLSTDATNTDINIFFLIGSVGLATPLTLPPSLGNTYCEINVTGTILSTGSSGTVVWMGTFTPFTSGTITPVIFTASPTVSTLNTTISNLVDIKAAWTTAMSGNSIGMLPIFTVKVQ